jgi:hypothetical protein
MDTYKKYIAIFDKERSLQDDIILNVKQDINRPNNPTDDKIIEDYIYQNYGIISYETEESETLEEISL